MTYNFTRSRVVIRKLTQAIARISSSEENASLEYVDQSLMILSRTSDIHSERMSQKFLSQREFIASQIKNVKIKIDERFKEVKNKMNEWFEDVKKRFEKIKTRFKKMKKKLNRHFKKIDKKVEEMNKKMRDYLSLIQNTSRNLLRIRGWEAISLVRLLDLRDVIHISEHFSCTVRHFWELKDLLQDKCSHQILHKHFDS